MPLAFILTASIICSPSLSLSLALSLLHQLKRVPLKSGLSVKGDETKGSCISKAQLHLQEVLSLAKPFKKQQGEGGTLWYPKCRHFYVEMEQGLKVRAEAFLSLSFSRSPFTSLYHYFLLMPCHLSLYLSLCLSLESFTLCVFSLGTSDQWTVIHIREGTQNQKAVSDDLSETFY